MRINKNLNLKKTLQFSPLLLLLFIGACKADDSRTCTTCNSPQTIEFEVCEESDGNASVNGEATGVRYDIYIADLELAGATCGG